MRKGKPYPDVREDAFKISHFPYMVSIDKDYTSPMPEQDPETGKLTVDENYTTEDWLKDMEKIGLTYIPLDLGPGNGTVYIEKEVFKRDNPHLYKNIIEN